MRVTSGAGGGKRGDAANDDAGAARDIVLLTRPRAESEQLAHALGALDVECIVLPTLEIVPVPASAAVAARIEHLHHYRLAVFVSVNAVRHGLALVRSRRDWPSGVQVAAIGNATARMLIAAGLHEVLVPAGGNDSEALLAHAQLQNVSGWKILIVRGIGGREHLADALRARGAQIDYLECYRRDLPAADPRALRAALADGRLCAVVAASAEGLRNLLALTGPDHAEALRAVTLLVHHPRVAQAASDLGFAHVQVAPAEVPALLPILASHLRRRGAA